jgi:hypothetical protein
MTLSYNGVKTNFNKYLIEHLKITTNNRKRNAAMVYLDKDRGDDPAREREETDTDRERREYFALGDLLHKELNIKSIIIKA